MVSLRLQAARTNIRCHIFTPTATNKNAQRLVAPSFEARVIRPGLAQHCTALPPNNAP